MNEMASPASWARAVRPTRWVYDRTVVGKSKLSTHETETKSIPRETPNSLSCFLDALAALRARLDGGAGTGEGERDRLLEDEASALAGSGEVPRVVEMTT